MQSCSNNTNKLSPQERMNKYKSAYARSNNTNKLSPQEHLAKGGVVNEVQIIQINLVLKNLCDILLILLMFK